LQEAKTWRSELAKLWCHGAAAGLREKAVMLKKFCRTNSARQRRKYSSTTRNITQLSDKDLVPIRQKMGMLFSGISAIRITDFGVKMSGYALKEHFKIAD
jgi:hypothetical protein